MDDCAVRVTEPVDGIAGTRLYEAVVGDVPVEGPRVAIVGLIHGNEPVGGDVIDRLAATLGTELKAGSVLTIRANLEAHAADLRHTDGGRDLNRLWDADTLQRLRRREQRGEPLCSEERRVLELAPLVIASDAILDLHSTSRPAAPFLLFRDDQRHAALARQLGVPNLVTGLHENAILPGGLCSNAGLRAGERSDRLGFTFEAGQHHAPDNLDRAWGAVVRLLHGLGVWRSDPPPADDVDVEVYEVVERFRQSQAESVPYRFVGFDGGEPGGGRKGPPRQLHSFEHIEADEVIVRRGRHGVVRAQSPFTMLMPAPDTDPGTDLFYYAQPRHGGLAMGRIADNATARREAMAIERMLDLVADDDLVRGSTWLSFDGRRLLDLCASVLGRTLRLPEGHPHRRITVVGRGDSDGGERERRHGQRYREAMRRAIAAGVPIERIQLMRGAPLAWLESLTSQGMLSVLLRRMSAEPTPEPVHMRISLRQPHTVSLLVAGDLDLALQTGDTRGVRVGVLIEAATIEPDGVTARVRVERAGMVSSRPEVLQAAAGLLAALREEHDHLVTHGALAHLREATPLLADNAIPATPDPVFLDALRDALYRLQLRLWCDALRAEVSQPVRLRSEKAVGRWLAGTMASTGIFDAKALEALVIRRTEKAWVADPHRLAEIAAAVDRKGPSALDTWRVARAAAPVRPLPRQPMMAADVTADDLERWVGWKRFVRGFQVVPDTRGKDLDLAYDEMQIRTRIAKWFRRARDLAARRPGDVLVVVAGDGLNPQREPLGPSLDLITAHRDLLKDPNVHYLRIQHAQGTHLSWFKDFLFTLQQRPAGQSVALQWEAEHGSTVNVVMLATRDNEVGARAWSLDGWDVQACAVVLSDLEGRGSNDYKLGLFTAETQNSQLSQELVHFGRAHCTGLLTQAGWRVRDARGAPPPWELERGMVSQIARWIERVRGWRDDVEAPDDAADWVARRLGLADARLARALAREMRSDGPVEDAAASLWDSVPAWPGQLWHSMGERD